MSISKGPLPLSKCGIVKYDKLATPRNHSTMANLSRDSFTTDCLPLKRQGLVANSARGVRSSSARQTRLVRPLDTFKSNSFSYLVRSNPLGNTTTTTLPDLYSMPSFRCLSTQSSAANLAPLYLQMEQIIKLKRSQLDRLKTQYGNVKIGDVTVSTVVNGMRDIVGLATETSELDPNFGIRLRGLTIEQLLDKLPRAEGCHVPLTEGVYWLLLTGKVPTLQQVQGFSREIISRAKLPQHVYNVLDALPPKTTHPMTQYIVAVSALQTESGFRAAYNNKTFNKDSCWRLALEDSLDLIAKNLLIVGYIYKRTYVDTSILHGQGLELDENLDYGANLAKLLGNDSAEFRDMMRLYLAVHSDHEGGNVSAHASHLIGSSLADPYFCFAGALGGLSGPLHGMANQECLKWILDLKHYLGDAAPSKELVAKFAQDSLASGRVIPGYGHAVLRVVDPRHSAFVKFAQAHFPQDPLVQLLQVCLDTIPDILQATGKVKNPHPNVDCSTGVLLHHFGFNHPDMFTVFFGISRALGLMSQLVWARALKFPLERPKSQTLDFLESKCS